MPREVELIGLRHVGLRLESSGGRWGMDNFSTIAILGVIAGAAWLWLRRGRGTSLQAETQLRRICLGNDAQVERLINGEMSRSPGISRAEAATRAVQRYQRDNR